MYDIMQTIESGEIVIIDGGTGTELERCGAPMNEKAWSARATLTYASLLKAIHEDYIRVGAEMIIANTFPATKHVLEEAGLGDKFEEVNHRAVQIAREVSDQAARPVAAAGSISTTTFTKDGALDYERLPGSGEAFDYYLEHARILAESGADLIVLEMMRDMEQTSFALRAAQETNLPVWVGFSCEPGDKGEMFLYGKSGPLIEAVTAVGSLRPAAVGVMHTQMEHTAEAVSTIASRWSGPVFAYPHRGVFEMPNWRFTDTVSPADFADAAVRWVKTGAQIIGGCCGIGPEHIRELSETLRARLGVMC